jgi:hypothetical protein
MKFEGKVQFVLFALVVLAWMVAIPFTNPSSTSIMQYTNATDQLFKAACINADSVEVIEANMTSYKNVLSVTEKDYDFWGLTPIRKEITCRKLVPMGIKE